MRFIYSTESEFATWGGQKTTQRHSEGVRKSSRRNEQKHGLFIV